MSESMKSRVAEPPTDYGSVLWALAGVWLLTERVCFVGVLCSSRRGTAAVFHVLSNTHIQLTYWYAGESMNPQPPM